MRSLIFLFVMVNFLPPLVSSFVIQPATQEDISEIIDIDKRVALEYFKPIYQEYYSEFSFGKDAAESLKNEIEADYQAFTQCVKTKSDEKLYIAIDREKNTIAGFIFFHKDADVVEIDLMCVDRPYRRLGIGKKLLTHAISAFTDIKWCFLYTLLAGNSDTHKFYEKLGFTGSAGSPERKNFYGIPHVDVYRYYTLDLLSSRMIENRRE